MVKEGARGQEAKTASRVNRLLNMFFDKDPRIAFINKRNFTFFYFSKICFTNRVQLMIRQFNIRLILEKRYETAFIYRSSSKTRTPFSSSQISKRERRSVQVHDLRDLVHELVKLNGVRLYSARYCIQHKARKFNLIISRRPPKACFSDSDLLFSIVSVILKVGFSPVSSVRRIFKIGDLP